MSRKRRTRPGANGTGSRDRVAAGSTPIVPPTAAAIEVGSHTIVREPTAWLRGVCGRRVGELREMGLDPEGEELIITTLPPTGDGWERRCDRCGYVTPAGELFYPVAHRPTKSTVIVLGLCEWCVKLEVG